MSGWWRRAEASGPGLGGGTAALAAVVALALTGGACSRGSSAEPSRNAAVPAVVEAAVRKDVPLELRAVGNTETVSTVALRPQVGGEITAVHFREGSDVRAGDVLFTIDTRPYEAALHQAEANLARDQANARTARLEAERGEALYKQDILAQDQHDSLANTALALDAAVQADRAAVEKARLDLAFCTIRSPIDGRTGSLLVTRGNVVKAIDGGPLVVINGIDPLFVSFSVPEVRLAELKAALAAHRLVVEALVPGDDKRPVRGELSFLDNAVARDTGTIRLRGTFPNRERRLWPGQFVEVRLTLGTRKDAVVVPSQALQAGQAGRFVFVVKGDGTAEARPVVAGPEVAGLTAIDKGLEAGERVVTDGQLRLVPGAKVQAREARP